MTLVSSGSCAIVDVVLRLGSWRVGGLCYESDFEGLVSFSVTEV